MKIALVSTGPLSGKSTLAEYLKAHCNFQIACHVCTLVNSYVEQENNARLQQSIRVGTQQFIPGSAAMSLPLLSASDVFANKEHFRQALQDHALAVGFHDPKMTGYWIERTLARTLVQQGQGVVFDPIRGSVQAKYLHDAGWTIVQLQISENERARRAAAMGKDYDQIWQAMQRHPDIEGGVDFADLVLDSETYTPKQLAYLIMYSGKGIRYDRHSDGADQATDSA